MSAGLLRSRRTVLLALAAACVPLACSRSDQPIEPVWGKEPCAYCKMLVSDKRYAAQIATGGERFFFDDLGCMVLWLETHEPPVRFWVHDAAGGGWLDAREAHYVAGAHTPMDFGFEAHAADGIGFAAMRDAVIAKKRNTR